MFRRTILVLMALLLVISGGVMAQDDPTPTPVPPVEANEDWEPVIEEIRGVPMALVPPGCFMMGAEERDMDEAPLHEQCLEDPFWLDVTEVTRASYEACVEDGACEAVPASPYSERETQPIVRVTWYQAADYCEWRGGRLPTEREWEYAAAGPDGWLFPWGDEFDNDFAVTSNTASETEDVGNRPGGASWVGVLDLAGNVWEWVGSIYEAYPYDPDDGREELPEEGEYVVVRGAAFRYDDDVRGANRDIYNPERGDHDIGFRCVVVD